MPRTIISTESPADIDRQLCVRYGIETIPLHINLDGRCYEDGVNISPADIYTFYKQERLLPKTAAVSIAEFSAYFSSLSANGASVVHLSISSEISSSYQNAVLAARDFDNVYVVDTRSLSCGMALLAVKAAEMAQVETNAAHIAAHIAALCPKVRATFIVDKLEFLRKGGRCSAVTAFGANLLNIKPSIEMRGGNLTVGKKYRGRSEACRLQYVRDILTENKGRIDTARVFLNKTAGVPDEQIRKIKKTVSEIVHFKEYINADAGCTITSHCGAGTFGLMFMCK